MFLLLLTCVFQFLLVNSDKVSNQMVHSLNMSLQRIHSLLSDVDMQIARERSNLDEINVSKFIVPNKIKLRSNLNNNMTKIVTPRPAIQFSVLPNLSSLIKINRKEKFPLVHKLAEPQRYADTVSLLPLKGNNTLPTSIVQKLRALQNASLFAQRPIKKSLHARRVGSDSSNQKQQDDSKQDGLSLEGNKSIDIENIWPESLEIENKIELKPNIKLNLRRRMKNNDVGYCSTALYGFLDAIVNKRNSDICSFRDGFGKVLVRMINNRQLKSLGTILPGRIELMWIWSCIMPISDVKENVNNALKSLENINHLDSDIATLLSDCDRFFEVREGDNLLEKIGELYEYKSDNFTDSKKVEKLAEAFIESILVPADRMSIAFDFRDLVNDINKAYKKRFDDIPLADITTIAVSILEYLNDTSIAITSRRSKGSSRKRQYRRFLRHLIKKHTSTISKYLKRYLNRRRHKSHHKICSTSEESDSSSDWNEDILEHKKLELHPNQGDAIEKWTGTVLTTTIPPENEIVRRSSFANAMLLRKLLQSRMEDPNHIDDTVKRIPPSILSRRALPSKGMPEKTEVLNQSSLDRFKNPILKKIMEDSSGSDEEIKLKTMLRYAMIRYKDTGNKL